MNASQTMFAEKVEVVTDKQGRKYLLRSRVGDTFLVIGLIYSRRRIGYVKSGWEGDTLKLGDINLEHSFIVPPNNLLEYFWRKVIPPKPISFRNLGLGTHLLEGVKQEARNLGLKRITGFVTPNDLAATPYLLAWYAKHGFRVTGPSDEDAAWLTIACVLE